MQFSQKLVGKLDEFVEFVKTTEKDVRQNEALYSQAIKRISPLLKEIKKGGVDEGNVEFETEFFKVTIY